MKIAKILVCVLISILASCAPETSTESNTYELVSDDMNILVEKFDSLNTNDNKYNINNEVFKIGSTFTYDFQHFTPKDEEQYFKVNDDNKSWSFVDPSSTDDAVVKSVIIGVLNGNPMVQFIPDYNQTAVSYRFKEGAPFSMSGVIENEANVWIHPPRDHYFKILELNPFPYIKAPYKVRTKWTWKLLIGSQWGDERWKTWEGNIENNYQYEITDKKTLKTSLGDLECLVVESTGKSRLGTTSLTAYFHPKYGFVQLDYINIDGSKTHLKLTKHSQ